MPVRNPRPPLETATGPVTPAERAAVEVAVNPPDLVTRKVVDGLLPFDEQRTASEIVDLRRQGMSIVVEIGRRLEQAREHFRVDGWREQGDGFKGWCERTGIGVRSAYNYIKVVRRLAETGLLDGGETPLLRIDAGVSKMASIIELDPEDIRTLNEGGEIEGVGNLTEVERMTAGELRARLKRREEEILRAEKVHTELREKNADLAGVVAEQQRRLAEPHKPGPIEVEMAGVYVHIVRLAREWQKRPAAERHAAASNGGAVFNMFDEAIQIVNRALLHDVPGTGYAPIPSDLSEDFDVTI